MIRLLKLEWLKFRNNNVIILLCLLYLILLPTTIFIGKQLNLSAPFPSNDIFFQFPTTWEWMAYSGSWFVFFFLGFVALFMVTSEISYKTLRQTIISGITREQYYLGKVYAIFIISLLATLYFTLVTITIGVIHTDEISLKIIFDNDLIILRYFLMCMGYMSFGILIGFTVKRSSLATLIYLSYILFIELLLKWQVHYKFFPSRAINFWPMNSIEDLTSNPSFKYSDFITKQQLDFDLLLSHNEAIFSSSIYILLFLGIGYFFFLRKDL